MNLTAALMFDLNNFSGRESLNPILEIVSKLGEMEIMKCQKELLILLSPVSNSPLRLSGHSRIMRNWLYLFFMMELKKK